MQLENKNNITKVTFLKNNTAKAEKFSNRNTKANQYTNQTRYFKYENFFMGNQGRTGLQFEEP